MERFVIKKLSGILLLILFFTTGCKKLVNHETGYLKGVISIGPICPVERIPPDPGCLPTAETYKAYPVGIFSSDGEKLVS